MECAVQFVDSLHSRREATEVRAEAIGAAALIVVGFAVGNLESPNRGAPEKDGFNAEVSRVLQQHA
jgi:hypothetical protein